MTIILRIRVLIDRIAFRMYLRQRRNCDSCSGTFRLGQLNPTSGDWWMCDACLQKLFEEDRQP